MKPITWEEIEATIETNSEDYFDLLKFKNKNKQFVVLDYFFSV